MAKPQGAGANALALAWIERRDRHHQARCTNGPCAGSISPTTAWSIAAANATVSTSRGVASAKPSRTGPGGVEPPAVIAAFDLASVEPPGRKRHAAMRTNVAQGKDRAVGVAADQQRFAEHDLGPHLSRFEPGGRTGIVPCLAQRRGVLLRPVVARYLLPSLPHPREICRFFRTRQG